MFFRIFFTTQLLVYLLLQVQTIKLVFNVYYPVNIIPKSENTAPYWLYTVLLY